MTHHLVGASEVAAILGVSRQRVAQLATAGHGFPAPEAELSAGRIWSREAIEAWAVGHPDRGVSGRVKTPAAGTWPLRIRTVLGLASSLARELHHTWIGPDHLFLALLHPDCPGVARATLESFGLTLDDCRDGWVASMGDPYEPTSRGITLAPITYSVLERSKTMAVENNDEEVTSEHVLLALAERWDRGSLVGMVARRGVSAAAVGERTLAFSEGGDDASVHEWPRVQLGAWPDVGPRLGGLKLAASPAGHDPWRRRSWGSVMFVDGSGSPVTDGDQARQYYIDRDGYPVLTTDGRPVHIVRDDQGEPVVGPVEIPPGCTVEAVDR